MKCTLLWYIRVYLLVTIKSICTISPHIDALELGGRFANKVVQEMRKVEQILTQKSKLKYDIIILYI
jgi:hypothetical protein